MDSHNDMSLDYTNRATNDSADRFFECAADAMCVIDADGYLIRTNAALRQIAGFEIDTVPLRRFVDFVHPDDAPAAGTHLAQLSPQADSAHFQCRFGTGDGEYFMVSWNVCLDAETGQLYAIGRDVSESVQAERSVREGRAAREHQPQFFESILYHLGDIVYAWNRENQFIYGNRRIEEIWGMTPEEFVGKTPAELGYTVELQELFKEQIEQVFVNKEAIIGEIPYTSPTNESGYYEYLFSPVLDDDGNVEFVGGVSRNTTRSRLAEDALREAQNNYRTLFDSMDQGYLLCDVFFDDDHRPIDLEYVEANPAAITMMGIDPTGKRLTEIDPGYEPYWYEIWGNVATTGEAARLERYAEPVQKWINFYIFRPDAENAESRRVAMLFHDVTERRRAEEALRESEARQAFLLDLSDKLRELSEPRDIMVVASELLGKRLGVAQVGYVEFEDDQDTAIAGGQYSDGRLPNLVGRRFRLSDYGPGFGPAMRAGQDIFYEDLETEPLATPGGSNEMRVTHVRAGAGIPLNKNDRLVAYLYAAHPERRSWSDNERRLCREVADRTWAAVERARAEQALRESEARFRASVEISTLGVLFFNLDGQITDANDAFLNMSGYSRAELEDGLLRWDELTPQEWLHVSYTAFDEMRSAGQATPYEKEYVRKDGSRWWALIAAKMMGDGGNIKYVLDITERKQSEVEREHLLAEVERDRRAAEEAVRARDVFLSIASHELRNPLTTIKASAQLLRRSILHNRLDEQRGDRLTSMLVESTDRLDILVSDLLDVSRLQSGQLRADRQPTDIAQLVRDVVAEQGGSHPVQLDLEEGPLLYLDAERIRQVLVNVLDNAVKYSPGHNEIQVSLRHNAESSVLSVRDQGIGLPEGETESIFEPFGRASNAAASNIPGMGLGLYICRGIAEAHGGELWAESDGPGLGTTVYLRLPLEENERL